MSGLILHTRFGVIQQIAHGEDSSHLTTAFFVGGSASMPTESDLRGIGMKGNKFSN
jgi:hypothetical protein